MASRTKATETSKYLGTPCAHGHEGIRYLANSKCVACTATDNRVRRSRKDDNLLQSKRVFQTRRSMVLKAGVEFTISFEELGPAPPICPVLGTRLTWAVGVAGRESSPSMDRINSALGYVVGNVIWVSWRANAIKRNATPDELRRVANFYSAGE